MELLWDREMEVCSNGCGHMTKMATMPIYGKKLKKSSNLEQKADDLETWYASSGARVLASLPKWWRWVDHDAVYGKVKFVPFMLLCGKKVKQWIFRNYCPLWFETSNRWPKWQVSVDIKTLSPGGCMPPAPGLCTSIKSWKKMCKIGRQRISLKLTTNG